MRSLVDVKIRCTHCLDAMPKEVQVDVEVLAYTYSLTELAGEEVVDDDGDRAVARTLPRKL